MKVRHNKMLSAYESFIENCLPLRQIIIFVSANISLPIEYALTCFTKIVI